MKSSYIIPIAIILGGVVIAIAVYVSLSKESPTNPTGTGNPALVRPIGALDHVLGNPAAKVVIFEYSDFDCEYCKELDETLHQIIANEGIDGDVAWVYREFPLIEIHPNAMRHAEAAECADVAGGNDAFWKFKTELFTHQPANANDYGTFAKIAGVPGEAFATCFANAEATVGARIAADRENAFAIGAQGAPYSLIVVAGKPPIVMSGAYPYAAVKQLVEQALEK